MTGDISTDLADWFGHHQGDAMDYMTDADPGDQTRSATPSREPVQAGYAEVVRDAAPPSEPTPEFTLCEDTGQQAVRGACPSHGGDACLKQFIPAAALRAASAEPTDAEIADLLEQRAFSAVMLTGMMSYARRLKDAADLLRAAVPVSEPQRDTERMDKLESLVTYHENRQGKYMQMQVHYTTGNGSLRAAVDAAKPGRTRMAQKGGEDE